MRICSSIVFLIVTISMQSQLDYPKFKKLDQKDEYFGAEVSDPYRWLEDDRSEETRTWVEKQNKLTFGYLDKIPFRKLLKEKLTSLWNYEKMSTPEHESYYYYYFKNDGLQKHSVMYRRNLQGGVEEVFFDPNKFSPDGTVSLMEHSFSKDGTMLAMAFSNGGSDWRKILIMDCSYKTFVDSLERVKFSAMAWKGNDGLYYSTYDTDSSSSDLSSKTEYHKLMYHMLETNQVEDKFVFGGKENKYRYIRGHLTTKENFLIISAANNTKKNEIFIQNVLLDSQQIYHITKGIESQSSVLDEINGSLYISTDYKSPNRKLVKADLLNPFQEFWIDVIPEKKYPINIQMGGGYFWLVTTQDVTNTVEKYDYFGYYQGDVTLPGKGTVGGFGCKNEDSLIYYTFTNAISPSTIYKYDVKEFKTEVYHQPRIDFDVNAYETKQIFYSSKDGTKIPMTITHKKGINLEGKNPTILYGYGGFNSSLMPSFSTTVALWIRLGGIYAVANLRGGGEYGNKWHEQGIKMKKQNVFDDFIAAGDYLKKEGYTSTDHLAILGRSNGGLLVGATMARRPDFCKVALPGVGVMDMLRYHRFTAGAGWSFDYGTSEDSKEMFEYLRGYSPLHQLKPGVCYPATLAVTADHDDRVVPAHSFKFVSTLQENQSCANPALIRVDVRSGHGSGRSTDKIIDETVDNFAFTLYNLGVKDIKENLELEW